jgi:hypothetical protein
VKEGEEVEEEVEVEEEREEVKGEEREEKVKKSIYTKKLLCSAVYLSFNSNKQSSNLVSLKRSIKRLQLMQVLIAAWLLNAEECVSVLTLRNSLKDSRMYELHVWCEPLRSCWSTKVSNHFKLRGKGVREMEGESEGRERDREREGEREKEGEREGREREREGEMLVMYKQSRREGA